MPVSCMCGVCISNIPVCNRHVTKNVDLDEIIRAHTICTYNMIEIIWQRQQG